VLSCVLSLCSNINDVDTATSFYEAYCLLAISTSTISEITNKLATATPGSTNIGTASKLSLRNTFSLLSYIPHNTQKVEALVRKSCKLKFRVVF
jgi:hypothetical protein